MRQIGVLVDRQGLQGEAGRSTDQIHLGGIRGDLDRLVGQAARNVGQQLAGNQGFAGLVNLGGKGDLGAGLVVGGRHHDGVTLGAYEQSSQDRHCRPVRQAAGSPGDSFGHDIAFQTDFHCVPLTWRLAPHGACRSIISMPQDESHPRDANVEGVVGDVGENSVSRSRRVSNGEGGLVPKSTPTGF